MKKLLIYTLLIISPVSNIFAKAQQKTEIKTDNQKYIKQIEDYFNNIKTLKANFIQIDKNGRESSGVFLIKRPYMMKMDYTNPSTQVIIAKNNKVTHYDKELKEKTVTSMYSSPLSFILESIIKLDTVQILSVVDEHGILSITFCKKDPDIDGAITMAFQQNPFMLLKWEIFGSKKDINSLNSTQIILLNHEFGKKISNDEFIDP